LNKISGGYKLTKAPNKQIIRTNINLLPWHLQLC